MPAAKPAAPPAETVALPNELAELKAIEAQVEQVVAKVLPSVVGVQIGNHLGSGVVVTRDGIIMTAGHVVDKPGQKAIIRFPDGRIVPGLTLGLDHFADAGLLRITAKGEWPCAEKGQSGTLRLGSWCLAVGHPLGYRPGRPPVVRIGRVSARSPTCCRPTARS